MLSGLPLPPLLLPPPSQKNLLGRTGIRPDLILWAFSTVRAKPSPQPTVGRSKGHTHRDRHSPSCSEREHRQSQQCRERDTCTHQTHGTHGPGHTHTCPGHCLLSWAPPLATPRIRPTLGCTSLLHLRRAHPAGLSAFKPSLPVRGSPVPRLSSPATPLLPWAQGREV